MDQNQTGTFGDDYTAKVFEMFFWGVGQKSTPLWVFGANYIPPPILEFVFFDLFIGVFTKKPGLLTHGHLKREMDEVKGMVFWFDYYYRFRVYKRSKYLKKWIDSKYLCW